VDGRYLALRGPRVSPTTSNVRKTPAAGQRRNRKNGYIGEENGILIFSEEAVVRPIGWRCHDVCLPIYLYPPLSRSDPRLFNSFGTVGTGPRPSLYSCQAHGRHRGRTLSLKLKNSGPASPPGRCGRTYNTRLPLNILTTAAFERALG